MLDFRPPVQAPDYFSRRWQRRLLAWVMGIGLVVVACVSFAEFRGFLRFGPAGDARPIDTRFQPRSGGSSESDAVTITRSAAPRIAAASGGAAEIDEALLDRVRDDTPWIRNEEIDAWLNLWGVLERASDQDLDKRSTGKAGFVELFSQPKAFRGRLVTLRGSARQATYVEAAENSAGIEGYYRVILWPEGGPAEPVFLYVLALPRGFPAGEAIREDVEATGFFFKRMVYPAGDGDELRRAPVVMARSLEWQQQTTTARREHVVIGTLIGLAVLGVIGLVVVGFWSAQARRPRRDRLASSLPPIDDRDIVNVRESLDKLAEDKR